MTNNLPYLSFHASVSIIHILICISMVTRHYDSIYTTTLYCLFENNLYPCVCKVMLARLIVHLCNCQINCPHSHVSDDCVLFMFDLVELQMGTVTKVVGKGKSLQTVLFGEV